MDEFTHLSLWLAQEVEDELNALAARVSVWVPAPMPEDWR